MVQKLLGLDDGRWRGANKGKQIDEYYLREKLKGYVTPPAKGEGAKMPPRQWRPKGSPIMKWGYHELHFKDAFRRYLGRGLPSEAPQEPAEDDKEEFSEHPFSPGNPLSSASSASEANTFGSSNAYSDADDDADADGQSASKEDAVGAAEVMQTQHPHPRHTSAPSQCVDKTDKNTNDADDADKGRISGGNYTSEDNDNVTRFPRGPVGRRARKG
jgi:hypothetical protein